MYKRFLLSEIKRQCLSILVLVRCIIEPQVRELKGGAWPFCLWHIKKTGFILMLLHGAARLK